MGLVLIIFVLFLLINVGYAYLSKELKISGSTTVHSFTFDVGFHDNYDEYTGSAYCRSSINDSYDEYTFTSSLMLPEDSCRFTVDIENHGTLPAAISLTDDYGSSFSFPYEYSSNGYSFSATYSGDDLDSFQRDNSGTITIEVTRTNCNEGDTSCDSDSGSFTLNLSAVQASTN